MVGARDEGDFGTGMVQYCTAVRVPLRGLSSGVKRRIWRDRQIQTQAYNWGVEYALKAHNSGERIPSPRNHSSPLTQFRRDTGSEHSVLLQRGGFWSAVEAVKKWSKRRDQLLYTRHKASEGTGSAMGKLGAAVERLADAEALPPQVGLMGEALALYRDHHRRRLELADSGEGAALHLRPGPTDPELAQLAADERAEQIGEAREAADKALELFNAALKSLRAANNSAGVADKTRKRLRDLADKAHKSAASEAKADKRLLAHIARGEMRLFRSRRDIEQCSGPALVLFEGVLEAHPGQNLTWGGAVHVVDVTDKAGRVTRRTTPEHRKYHAHFLCRASARVNRQRHVAKAVVTTHEVRQVVLEDTKAFPTRRSSAKRGLNRSIAETAPARQAALIERAAVIHSVAVARVNPAYTSLTCFVCGEQGQRETQALFRCPECGSYTHADVQAALNVNNAGNPGLYPSARDVTYGGRDSRHKTLEDALGVFLDSEFADGSVTNKYARAATCGHSGI